ncbi:MAG: MmgE/PrpD family protein [Burkholderiaceae bacterium]
MTTERELARFAVTLAPEAVPAPTRQILSQMMLAVAGTAIAGAEEDGVGALRALLLEAGGTAQATTLVFGDRLPASAAAQLNGTMCRALDYCDAMAPGPHIGSALVPAALAAAELADGCSGAEFVTALAAGAEISSRLNLREDQYDGFDPTGLPVVFGATAAAARLLKLDQTQTHHALALAFNRCGGSFQSHVDGSLGVRFVQGWVAQAGVQCAQLARRGVTGPTNFLNGHYGYGHLYGRDTMDMSAVTADLGREWRLHRMVFKKYPSCGVTQGVTELTLAMLADGLTADKVASVEVRLPPYAHRLVGNRFEPKHNPRVDAQFSAAYCVANALVRKTSTLINFSPCQVCEPDLLAMVERINVVADPAMDARGHASVDLTVTRTDKTVLHRGLDTPPGFPGAELTTAQHLARFEDCLAYAAHPIDPSQTGSLLRALDTMEQLHDIRLLIPLLVSKTI